MDRLKSQRACWLLAGIAFWALLLAGGSLGNGWGAALAASTGAEGFVAPAPVLITSIGQSPDAFTLNVLAQRAQIAFEHNELAGAEAVARNASLLLAVGASQKGFGAAGIDLETELKRAADLIAAAEESGAPIIVAHIGGTDRRDPVTMRLLELVLPAADLLIVYQGGNQDGYFDGAAAEHQIPMVVLENVLNAAEVLEDVFR